ncbi:MAG TPA: TonB-dependent receptor [Ohtaekwangia sp.]
MKTCGIVLLVLISALSVPAQTLQDIRIPDLKEPESLLSVISKLEKHEKIKFFFREEWLTGFVVLPSDSGQPLENVLTTKFKDTGITFSFLYDYAVIIISDPAQFLEYKENLERAIESRKIIESRIIGDRKKLVPGKVLHLQGTVRDAKNKAPLKGVDMIINDRLTATTDDEGNYSIRLSGNEFVLIFKLPSFEEKFIDLQIFESGRVDVILEDSPTILEEVVFTGENLTDREIGQVNLSLQGVKRAPALLGEADVIRQIQQQPGVTTVGEVSNGFNVRGGGVDQNLVLYDGIPIFNTAHALGFFSAFNAYALQQVSFYRGGIPAEYGGRASSVLNITSREGSDEWHGNGGIGILSSYASVGGPLKKKKTTLMASARASYSDWILNMIKSDYKDLRHSSLSFYDASLKLAHNFTPRTKLVFSGYLSKDQFTLSNDTSYAYQNISASVSVIHSITDKLFVHAQIGTGDYGYSITEPEPASAFELKYGVTYPSLKIDFNYDGEHKLTFGFHSTFYAFKPGELKPGSQASGISRVAMPDEHSIESALYFADNFQLAPKLSVNAGVRLSFYQRIGKGTVYLYEPGMPMETRNIYDSVEYGGGELMKAYAGVEPRLAMTYSLHKDGALKFGYNRMYQYLHLITNTASVTPVDIWQSSNTYFKPQIADQFSFGYARELRENSVEVFAEVFYKSVQNVLDFKDGAKLLLNPQLETALLPGRATSYGLELSAEKLKGRLIGSVNYTFSRSFRKGTSSFESENINQGEQYPSNYDQPHIVNLSWRYGITRRYFFTGFFTYHTGRPVSLPHSTYSVDGVPVLDFPSRNNYRLSDYHRLDVALIIEGNHKRKKVLDGSWTISLYNVYGRKNAYSVFYADDGRGNIKPYKLSVIGSIVPSISYSFKF